MKDLCSIIFVCVLLSLIYAEGDSIKKKKKNAVNNLKARANTNNTCFQSCASQRSSNQKEGKNTTNNFKARASTTNIYFQLCPSQRLFNKKKTKKYRQQF